MREIKIQVRDDNKKLVKKFLDYNEQFDMSTNNMLLKEMVEETVKEFGEGDIEDPTITCKMIW